MGHPSRMDWAWWARPTNKKTRPQADENRTNKAKHTIFLKFKIEMD
jgi:hypothetical protein